MRVVVDLQSNQSGSRLGGIGRYSFELLAAMIERRPDWDFVVLLNDAFPQAANEVRFKLRTLVSPSDIVTFKVPPGCAPIHGNHELTRAAEILRERFIAGLDPDIVHVTSLVEGLHDDVVTSIGCLGEGPPTATTLYDLIPMAERTLYLSDQRARAHYFSKIRSMLRSDCLLAISRFSAADFRARLPSYDGPIVNVRGGVDRKFRTLERGPVFAAVRARYGLDRPFVLYTASFDLRKNQSGLIAGFAALDPAIRARFQLAFVGGGWPEEYDRLRRQAASFGLDERQVRFLGRVPDEDLVALYNACHVFAFPPKWEGLGMPALEAMACGAAVIGSNTTSVTEVVGWEDATFDPEDPRSIARTLRRALVDDAFRSECIARGREHVRQFRWTSSAEAACEALTATVARRRVVPPGAAGPSTAELLRERIAGEDLLDAQLEAVSFSAAANDLQLSLARDGLPGRRVGWVTSWNARCGIAAYSRHLAEHVGTPPIIFASYVDEEAADRGDTFPVVRCWAQGKSDHLVELETAIENSDLDTLLVQFNYGFYEFGALRDLLVRQVWSGRKVFVTLHSTLDQTDEESFCLAYLRDALALATGLFVHSPHDLDRLAALGIADNVVLLPHGMPAADGSAEEPRGSDTRIATYGFFLPGKGLPEIVRALPLVRAVRPDVRLDLVNARYPDPSSAELVDAVKATIAELGLDEAVSLVDDFLSDAESLRRLRSASLVVYPYTKTGESASGAVRLGLASGRPVAVTPLPIFDDVRDAVLDLPGTTPEAIAIGILRTLEAIERNDPAVAERLAVARRWSARNAYPEVAAFMEATIAQRAAVETWSASAPLRPTEHHLLTGRIEGSALVSTTDGILNMGPYLTLGMGNHRLTVRGQVDLNGGDAVVRLTAECGQILMEEVRLRDLGTGVLLDAIIPVPDTLSDVEFVFAVSNGATLRVDGYTLSQQFR